MTLDISTVLKEWQDKGIIDLVPGDYEVKDSPKERVTDITVIQPVSTALAVTHDDNCHKCGKRFSENEPICWYGCWCGQPTLTRRNLAIGTRSDGSFGYGYAPCYNTPQPFCLECTPSLKGKTPGWWINWRKCTCFCCGREFYVRVDIPGRRHYCSDRCAKTVSIKKERLNREAKRAHMTCTACGSSFTGTRKDQRYCSVACKQKLYRWRVNNGALGVEAESCNPGYNFK